jgi:hypothetical protein
MRNHDQTLEQLAKRGGLSPAELLAVLQGKRWKDRTAQRDLDAVPELLRLLKEGTQSHPAPPPHCRVCGLPVPSPSYGGPDLCPTCDCGVYRDGAPWTYKEATNLELVRRNALAREEDGFSCLRPPRARPLKTAVLASLKAMLELVQDGDQAAEAQALCVAIECIEQLSRLMNQSVRSEPYRRGANWSPTLEQIQGAVRCFFGQDEVCALCLKHIRDHYGDTEYRCDPDPTK